MTLSYELRLVSSGEPHDPAVRAWLDDIIAGLFREASQGSTRAGFSLPNSLSPAVKELIFVHLRMGGIRIESSSIQEAAYEHYNVYWDKPVEGVQ